ncbi:MAG: BrnT family toxin [bacterium]|nr:BrnT family toxin [Gammaproteobacteria bacterium]HIL85505.1 BrnT family toxin [Pseudomonadales bacterium]
MYHKFCYDKRKSASNKTKHGITFEEAQALWEDRVILKIPSIVNTIKESRFLYIGLIGSKHWTAITTHREPIITRIISVRLSRKQEVELYES